MGVNQERKEEEEGRKRKREEEGGKCERVRRRRKTVMLCIPCPPGNTKNTELSVGNEEMGMY